MTELERALVQSLQQLQADYESKLTAFSQELQRRDAAWERSVRGLQAQSEQQAQQVIDLSQQVESLNAKLSDLIRLLS